MAALPFADGTFDAVLCQMALMFFPDRAAALARDGAGRDRRRAPSPSSFPSALETQAAFKPFVELAARIAGPEAMSLLTTYFVCGDLGRADGAVRSRPGSRVTERRSVTGTYSAPSVDAAVTTEVESTPLIERIDEATYRQLREEAVEVMAPFTAADGSLVAPFECLVVAATRR